MNKTINVGDGKANVEINQTTITKPPEGPSVGGVSLSTGWGWGFDLMIVLVVVGMLYLCKKGVDKWIR